MKYSAFIFAIEIQKFLYFFNFYLLLRNFHIFFKKKLLLGLKYDKLNPIKKYKEYKYLYFSKIRKIYEKAYKKRASAKSDIDLVKALFYSLFIMFLFCQNYGNNDSITAVPKLQDIFLRKTGQAVLSFYNFPAESFSSPKSGFRPGWERYRP